MCLRVMMRVSEVVMGTNVVHVYACVVCVHVLMRVCRLCACMCEYMCALTCE